MRIPSIEEILQGLQPVADSPRYKPAPEPGQTTAMGGAVMQPPEDPSVTGPRAHATLTLPPVDDRIPASEGVTGLASMLGGLAGKGVQSGAEKSASAIDAAMAGQVSQGASSPHRQALLDESDQNYRDALAKLHEAASNPEPTRQASPIGHKEAIGALVAAGLLKAVGVPDRVIGDMARGFIGVRTAQAESEFQRKSADFAAKRNSLIQEAEALKGESTLKRNRVADMDRDQLRIESAKEAKQKVATDTVNRLIGLASAGRTDPEVFQAALHFAKANGVEFDSEYVANLVKAVQTRRDTADDIDRMTRLMPQMFKDAANVRDNPASAIMAAGFILGMAKKYPDAFPTLFNVDADEVKSQMESVLTVAEQRRQELEIRNAQVEAQIAQGWANVGIRRDQADATIAESTARINKAFAETAKILEEYSAGKHKDVAAARKRIEALVKDRNKLLQTLAGFDAEAAMLEEIDEIAAAKSSAKAAKIRAEIQWIENHIVELEQISGIRTPSVLKGPIPAGDGVPRARPQVDAGAYAPINPVAQSGAINGTFNGKPFRIIPK